MKKLISNKNRSFVLSFNRVLAFILLVCSALSLISCANNMPCDLTPANTQDSCTATADNTQAPDAVYSEITVNDMIGREVKVIPGSYKRVVCIGAGALRMYSYVCDVALLCGVEDIDNLTLTQRPKMFDTSPRPYVMVYSDVFSLLPSCGVGGPNAQAAEAEKILSCNPDIVISEYQDADKENALQEQLGVPVITLKSGPSGVFADDFKGSMRLLGKIFGAEARAEEIVGFVEKEAAEITRRTSDIPDGEKPLVYISGLGSWGTTNHLMTSENYSTFQVASIKNAVSGLGIKGIGAIDEEKFISVAEKTDIMFIDAAAVKNIKPLYKEDSTMFDCSKAWKNGEVYLQMAYNSYYTNYEIALANAWFIAKTVYPKQFEDIDMEDKLNEITKLFLGKELAEEIYSSPASYGGYSKIDTESFFD